MGWRERLAVLAEAAYDSAVEGISGAYNGTVVAIDWVGGVLQGDFKEDQTVAQIITNAVLSSIPIVGWVADGRDVVANIIKLTDEKHRRDFFVWLALVATLIGIIPGVGDAIKAVVKIVIQKGVDTLIPVLRLLERLGLGDRIKLLKDIKWGEISTNVLAKFNEIMGSIIAEVERLLSLLPSRFRDSRIAVSEFLDSLRRVQEEGQAKVQEAVYWIRDKLNDLISRYEANPEFSRARPNVTNLRRLTRQRLTHGATDADEVAQLERHNLQYANNNSGANGSFGGFADETAYRNQLRNDGLGDLADDDYFFNGQYRNFSDVNAQRILPNQGNDGYLYRVFDQHPTQGAKPQGSYWSLTPPTGTEDQWRAGSAVKRQWNEDGMYARMPIPEEGLPAMTGVAARQGFDGSDLVIPGGDQQLYIPRSSVEAQFEKSGSNITTHNSPWNTDGNNTVSIPNGTVWEDGE